MNFRIATVAAVFAAFAFASPASAAMPVSGASAPASDSVIVQVAKKKKMTPRQEADQSAKDGTVPARYRNSIPKEYHQYIPFAKQ